MRPLLPPELQFSIIDFVADEKDAFARQLSLARCALVTKRWHRHATRRLWLESFAISFSHLKIHQLKTFFDPENRGWHLLSLDRAPKLRDVSFSITWANVEGEGWSSIDVLHGLKAVLVKAFERCVPEWEADGRNIRRVFDVRPQYNFF